MASSTAAAARPRRGTTVRATGRTRKKDDTDELAKKLETNLKISETVPVPTTKSRRTVTTVVASSSKTKIPKRATATTSAPEVCDVEKQMKDAMGVVNTVLQHLTTAIEHKWTVSLARKGGDVDVISTTSTLVSSARNALATIRKGCDGLPRLDVERATLGLLGKLVQTEMYKEALEVASGVRVPLCQLIGLTEETKASSLDPLTLLSLPLPQGSDPLDATLQTMVLSYLQHSSVAVIRTVNIDGGQNNALLDNLFTSGTLVPWISCLKAVPQKTLDAALKRAYMTLGNTSSSPSTPSTSSLLTIRFTALRYLLHTSDLSPCSFWEQCLKFGVSFVKTNGSAGIDEKETAGNLLKAFNDIVTIVDEQGKGELKNGKRWLDFCEYWSSLAKRVRDRKLLSEVTNLIHASTSDQNGTMPSSDSSSQRSELSPSPSSGPQLELSQAKLSKTCSTFTQVVALLESLGTECVEPEEIQHCFEAGKASHSVVKDVLATDPSPTNSGWSKLLRGSEKMRRACLMALERSPSHRIEIRSLLACIIDDYEAVIQNALSRSRDVTEIVVSTLDTLFTLASTSLSPQDPTTCELVYSYLTKATSIVDSIEGANAEEQKQILIANYTRCISGAFFNAAGALYKAGKYGHAVRFLNDAAPLAVKAMRQYNDAGDTSEDGVPRNEKDAEVWKTHRSQLFKRFELLAACQSKLSNRKHAFDAFVQSVVYYQYDDAFLTAVQNDATVELFQEHAQLASMTDRLTYIGSAELFFDAQVSLLQPLQANKTHPLIIGALIERQKRSLEESKWKTKIQKVVQCLLDDLLLLYNEDYPIRCARVSIWKLEMAYFCNDQRVNVNIVAQTALESLEVEDLRGDANIAHSKLQYRTTVFLWLILHAHRIPSAEGVALVLRYTDDAQRTLSQLAGSPPRDSVARVSTKRPNGCVSSIPKTRRVARPSQRKRMPVTELPVTPKARRESLGVVNRSGNHDLDRRSKSATIMNDSKTLLTLAYTVSQILGLLGHALVKVRLLHTLRRVCEKDKETYGEEYVKASVELAHELAQLGKFERAASLYSSLRMKEFANVASYKVLLDLRFAEVMAISGNTTKSVSLYEEAQRLFATITFSDKSASTSKRVRHHAQSLELTAVASVAFACIKLAECNSAQALKSLLQALRLLNRAIESLSRLNQSNSKPSQGQNKEENPFAMSDLKEALPSEDVPASENTHATSWTSLDGLEWRIGSTLLQTMFLISQVYSKRGFARESEFFAQQAEDLAWSLNAPSMVSRALSCRGEVQLLLGKVHDAQESLSNAVTLVQGIMGADAAQARRLQGDSLLIAELNTDAQNMYLDAIRILGDTGSALIDVEAIERKSIGSPSTPRTQQKKSLVAPVVMASILRQHIWLLRDDAGNEYDKNLERLLALPQLQDIQAESNFLLGKLALHSIFQRFRQDLFLSSLAESPLSIPTGVVVNSRSPVQPIGDTFAAFEHAEKIYLAGLESFKDHGTVQHLRGAAKSLALIKTFQSSLGRSTRNAPSFVAQLLDFSCSVTINRELVEAVTHKLNKELPQDAVWPNLSSSSRETGPRPRPLLSELYNSLDDDPEDITSTGSGLRQYWEVVLARHSSNSFTTQNTSPPGLESLPEKWAIVHIGITEDKCTLLISRQRAKREPLVFCVPLKGRRESEDDEQFSYEDAIGELKDIIQSSDEGTRLAVHIKTDDKEAKSSWWTERKRLDQRLKSLLSNIEFCWLGAFKTILCQPMDIPPEVMSPFRTRLEKIFKGIIGKGKKNKGVNFKFEANLLECLASLKPSCRDEELEDLIYFVLDLYHFQGVPVAPAEVDIDHATVDLRSALEEHNARVCKSMSADADAHTFLVLDKSVQGIPWESLPILRGCSVSRIPSVDFLLDRIDLARTQRGESLQQSLGNDAPDRFKVDPTKGFFMLNPGGDLRGTEDRFTQWAKEMKSAGWEGIVGKQPSEQQLLNALSRKEMVVYFGHGGAEQYIRSHKIRHLQRCATTMLWGCSSGALRDMGEFDRVGTPYNYMLAGCPTLVANLWDVTDRDIDKFAMSVFDKLHLHGDDVKRWRDGEGRSERDKVSVVTAVAQSREVCKLKYLTGAAPVVYGIPFYL